MENRTKLRLLYLYKHLIKYTNPDSPLSTVELAKVLKDTYGISVSRNTISNDLVVLRNSNLHIEYIESTQNKYYYNGHPFEISELKILIDALLAAKFITEKISRELIAKLLTLTTEENAKSLSRHISVENRVKSESRSGYYSVDVINSAIDSQRKISFQYTDYDVNKQRYITNNEGFYTLSPYDLIWDGDYYYVRGFCDERQAMRNFRLDRIKSQPVLLNQSANTKPKEYISSAYNKEVFRMFDTDKPVQVELLCDVSVMKYMIDSFGSEIQTEPIDPQTFKAWIFVCTSTTFYRWVFGFNGKIKILGPINCVEAYKEMLKKMLNQYE